MLACEHHRVVLHKRLVKPKAVSRSVQLGAVGVLHVCAHAAGELSRHERVCCNPSLTVALNSAYPVVLLHTTNGGCRHTCNVTQRDAAPNITHVCVCCNSQVEPVAELDSAHALTCLLVALLPRA
jgi:hypothetical protein